MGIFAAVATLIGRGGDVDLAAHQIAISLASYAYMNAVGIASATTARVGFHVGAERPDEARVAGLLGMGLGASFMMGAAAVFLFAAGPLASLFSAEPDVQALGTSLLRVAGAFAVVDGIQVVSAGALRGAADTKMAFYVNLVAHWLIGLPVGLLLHGRIGPAGYWWGLTAGLSLVAVVLCLRFVRLSPVALQKRSAT